MMEPPSDAPRRLARGPLAGRLRPPGSKSLAIRALLAAAVTGGRTRIAGLSGGDDVRAARALLGACQVELRALAPAAVEVTGRPPGPSRGPAPRAALDAGESGTLARLASALLGLCAPAGWRSTLGVSGTLRRRASPALFEALAGAGVGVLPLGPAGGWPVALTAIGPPPSVRLARPGSSQEASALLLGLAAWPGESELEILGAVPSRPYLEMTARVLERFGAAFSVERAAGGERWRIAGPLEPPAAPFVVEADASAAAVALAAACLSGGAVEVGGVGSGSLQGDARIAAHLCAFGCDAEARDDALLARGAPTRGAELDLSGEPDLAPVLAAVAAAAARAGHASRLTGLATLEGKESPRVRVLAEGLRAVGLAVEHGPAHLAVAPGGAPLPDAGPPLVLDPRADHRMAFAFALLGLAFPRVRVADPGCVAKSWPGFWRDLDALAGGAAAAG